MGVVDDTVKIKAESNWAWYDDGAIKATKVDLSASRIRLFPFEEATVSVSKGSCVSTASSDSRALRDGPIADDKDEADGSLWIISPCRSKKVRIQIGSYRAASRQIRKAS